MGLLPDASEAAEEGDAAEELDTDSGKSNAGDVDTEDNTAEVLAARRRAARSAATRNSRPDVAMGDTDADTRAVQRAPRGQPVARGMPWFEELVEDSRLGKVRRKGGGHRQGGEDVEWEIVEVGGNEEGEAMQSYSSTTTTRTVKRKLGDEQGGMEGEVVEMIGGAK